MELFKRQYHDIRNFLARNRSEGKLSQVTRPSGVLWPRGTSRNLVLGKDTAVELGNPKSASTSYLLCIDNPDELENGRISIVGPDVSHAEKAKLPFGKIVILGGSDFTVDNFYDRYQELEQLRYEVQLSGYMMRGVSQYRREWSRISKEAIRNGFSLSILGGALIDKYLELDYVQAVETIFITSDSADVLEMKTVSDGVARIIGAMNKMASEMSFDCDSCEYTDVCEDVSEMRSMRRTMGTREAAYA